MTVHVNGTPAVAMGTTRTWLHGNVNEWEMFPKFVDPL